MEEELCTHRYQIEWIDLADQPTSADFHRDTQYHDVTSSPSQLEAVVWGDNRLDFFYISRIHIEFYYFLPMLRQLKKC